MDLQSIVNEVGSWPPEDRLRLIEAVWDGLAASPERVPLSERQKQDLQRRLDAYRADPKAGDTWETVRARLQGESP